MQRSSLPDTTPATRDRGERVYRTPESKRFESLLGDLSMAMARASADMVDSEIESWLGRICEVLDLDRSAVYEREAQSPVRTTHTWVRAGIPAFPHDFAPEKLVKATTDWVLAGNQLVFSHAEELPAEFEDLKRFAEQYGPKASAILPMWAGSRVIGGASFGKFRASRRWSPDLLEHLRLAVRFFGVAIERKQAERELRTALTHLRTASRRNMMSELVGSLAHEINQPISAILSNLSGLARLLSRKEFDSPLALTAVRNAIEDTQRTAQIIRRIRAMFKTDTDQRSAIRPGELVEGVARLIAGEAAMRKITLSVEIAPALPRVIGEPIQLQQCVLNLTMNAFEALTEAGREPRCVTIRVAPEKPGWVSVNVSDTGVGIDPEIANDLFKPFVTTKREGMGLGLLVTRSIVENHGGRIWATPNPTTGTTFSFTLPTAGVGKRARIRKTTRPAPV